MDLLKDIKKYTRNILSDERGTFLKVITGNEDSINGEVGEIYFTSAVPGTNKGGHYHPEATEWFTLIRGKALLRLEDINSKEQIVIELDSENPETICIPTNIAHCVENPYDEEFLLCAYTNRKYEPADTIQYNFKKDL